jgi:hypothetical protein
MVAGEIDQARAAAPFRHNKTYRLKTNAGKIRDNEMSTTVQAVNVKRSVTGLTFAGLGALFVVLEIHTFAAWMLSPEFHATPVGADAVPANVKSIIDHYQIGNSVIGVLALLWFIQGIIRHRRIGPVRLMMVGWLSAYWLDPWLSFLRPVFTYNAYAFNRGCWCTFMPFWQNPSGARIAEPLLIDPSSYFYNFTLVAVLAWVVMRWARKQRPSLSTPALFRLRRLADLLPRGNALGGSALPVSDLRVRPVPDRVRRQRPGIAQHEIQRSYRNRIRA